MMSRATAVLLVALCATMHAVAVQDRCHAAGNLAVLRGSRRASTPRGSRRLADRLLGLSTIDSSLSFSCPCPFVHCENHLPGHLYMVHIRISASFESSVTF